MDQTEQQYIDRLFDKLRAAEGQSGPRDAEAERYIGQLIARQPSLTYYMAQAIIVQEEALKNAQQQMQEAQHQIEDLERELDNRPAQGAGGGGGFLGGLFGGGGSPAPAPTPSYSRSSVPPSGGSVPRSGMSYPRNGQMEEPSPLQQYGQQQPYGQPQRGGGFLAGAMQTAAGVAGGVLLGNMLGNMFGGGDAAKAGEAAKPEEAKPEAGAEQQAAAPAEPDPFANVENTQYDENDSDMGGFFGGGDDFGGDI